MAATTRIADVVESEYNYLRKCLQNEWKKYHKTEFDEDLFHDTIIKCMEQLDSKELTKNEIISYIVSSFKTNMLRDTKYARNSKKTEDDAYSILIPINDKDKIDIGMVKDNIYKIFGEDKSNMFSDWLSGMTIKEINEKYDTKKARYIIDDIKAYIKQHYKLDDFR